MSTEYGTARWLREEYDPETRLLTITVCDMKGDWNHYAERVRIVPADAIVIERAELPGVDFTSDGAPWSRGQTTQSAEKARAVAVAFLALAEYLAAHPPVPPVSDEDVETLAGLILSDPSIIDTDGVRDITRRLLATGRVRVTK